MPEVQTLTSVIFIGIGEQPMCIEAALQV